MITFLFVDVLIVKVESEAVVVSLISAWVEDLEGDKIVVVVLMGRFVVVVCVENIREGCHVLLVIIVEDVILKCNDGAGLDKVNNDSVELGEDINNDNDSFVVSIAEDVFSRDDVG